MIYKLRDLLGVEEMGGTMRLGAYPCNLREGTLAHRIYGATRDQRAPPPPLRVQPEVLETLVEHGLVISGISPDGKFVEMVELADHPWFLGCQFHPEFKSKPFDPHPLFVSYIRAALEAHVQSGRHGRAHARAVDAGAARRRSARALARADVADELAREQRAELANADAGVQRLRARTGRRGRSATRCRSSPDPCVIESEERALEAGAHARRARAPAERAR